MTYEKVRHDSMYLRSHPYAGVMHSSSRGNANNKNEDSDLWNVLGTVGKFFVSSASGLVKKISGSPKHTSRDDLVPSRDSLVVSESPHSVKYEAEKGNFSKISDIDRTHTPCTKSWVSTMMSDPNLSENVKQRLERILEIENRENFKYRDTALSSERSNRRYIKPRDPTTSKILSSQINRFDQTLSLLRPNPRRLAFGEIDSRSEVHVSTPSRQSSKQISVNRLKTRCLGSKSDMDRSSSCRRPWSSTLSSARRFISRGVGPSPRMRRSGVSPTQKPKKLQYDSPYNFQKGCAQSLELKTYSPIYPREIFTHEQSRKKDGQMKESGPAEYAMTRTYRDPTIKAAVTNHSLDRPKFAKEDLHRFSCKISSPLFKGSARRNWSTNTIEVSKKRKSYMDIESEPFSKRARVQEIKERTTMKLDSSKIVDHEDVYEGDEQVSLIMPEEECEIPSIALTEIKPAVDVTTSQCLQTCLVNSNSPVKAEQSSKVYSDCTKKPVVSCAELSTREKSTRQVFQSTKLRVTSKPPVDRSTAETASGSPLEEVGTIFNLPRKTDQCDGAGLEDGEEEKQKEGEEKINIPLPSAEKCSAALFGGQRLASPVLNTNVSYACRKAKLMKIKIRDHYTFKIEELYDMYCKENGKDERKMKAVATYRDKYHPLKEDHVFFAKLCKKYNVDPGKEYTGVDSDVKSVDTGSIDAKPSEIDEQAKIEPTIVPVPAVVNPAVPKIDVPHHNPFDIDHVEEAAPVKSGGVIFTESSVKTKNIEKLKNVDLFGSINSNHTNINGQTVATTNKRTKSVFVAKDLVAHNGNNPFCLSANAKPTQIGFNNTKTPVSSSLFSTSNDNASEMKNNFALNNKPKVEEAGKTVSSPDKLEMSMMDIETPSGNNNGSGVPPQNLFGSSGTAFGSGNNTNLFAISDNKVGSQSTTNLFGTPGQNPAQSSSTSSVTVLNATGNLFTNQFGAKRQSAQSDNPFSKLKHSVNPFSTAGSSQMFGATNGIFKNNPFGKSTFNNIDFAKGAKFSLGSFGGPKSRKRRPIVRGRRTLR